MLTNTFTQSRIRIHHLENRWNEMILLVMNLDTWKIVMRTNIDCMNSRDVMKEGSKWISAPPMLIIIHTHLRLPLPNVRMFDGRRLITNVLMDYLPKFKSKYFCALDLFPNIIRHLCNFRFMHTSLILLNIRTFAHCFYRILLVSFPSRVYTENSLVVDWNRCVPLSYIIYQNPWKIRFKWIFHRNLNWIDIEIL